MEKFALGTAQFGMAYGISNNNGRVPRSEVYNIIEIAKRQNIDTIDTAINYGISEEVLGEVGVKEFKVYTKIPDLPVSQKNINEWVFRHVNNSLKKLKVNKLQGVYLHKSNLFNNKEIKDALVKLKVNGLVSKIGISIYSPLELEELDFFSEVDIVQAPLNLIDNRIVTSGWLYKIAKSNIEIHTRSVFLQGLLLMKYEDIPVKLKENNIIWKIWYEWLKTTKISALEASLKYVMQFPEIFRIILGVESKSHIEQIFNIIKLNRNFKLPNICSENETVINPYLWNSK